MGYGAWSNTSYTATATAYREIPQEQLFSDELSAEFDPLNIAMRESRDSDDSPESTAIIIGLDVTGSMGHIADFMAKESLGILVEGILDTKPVTDPHIMMMGIGDLNYDRAPLQVTQFEADNRISDQLVDLYLEGGGGGNSYESYDLPWLFASTKTYIDCFEKRGKKGYLFTIGDEEPPRAGSPSILEKKVGLGTSQLSTSEGFLAAAQEKYEVFHVIVEQGYHASSYLDRTVKKWNEVLGKRAIRLKNYKHISEVILSVMRVNEGADPEEVISSWQDEKTQKTVRHALFS